MGLTKRGDSRIVRINVGGAMGIPRNVWALEFWRSCDCPDCEKGYHWMRQSGWYETLADAEAARVR